MTGRPRARAAAKSGDLLLDRGRHHEGRAVVGDAAAVLGHDDDAKPLELGAKRGTLAAIEGAVAAARAPAGHDLKLRQRAHAGAAEARVMKAAAGPWIGHLALSRFGDQDEIALADLVEQTADVGIGHAHAAMGGGAAEEGLVIGAVNINVALERIAARAAVHTVFRAVEGEDAGEDQIVVAQRAAPDLAGRLARDEYGAGLGVSADALLDAMPAGRRAEGALLAANARPRRRHRPRFDRLPIRDQYRALALHIDDEEARRQCRRRSRAR